MCGGGRYSTRKLENLILFSGNCDEGDLVLGVRRKTSEKPKTAFRICQLLCREAALLPTCVSIYSVQSNVVTLDR